MCCVLSALGLLLAVIGLFGAISCSVSEWKKELGIRVALGASPWQLLQMDVRQTMFVAGAEVAIGILLGIGGTILFRPQLYGIGAVEWTVLLPVGAAGWHLHLTDMNNSSTVKVCMSSTLTARYPELRRPSASRRALAFSTA
jgi:ABC-type antimicrobial peptide transport system permease subunit